MQQTADEFSQTLQEIQTSTGSISIIGDESHVEAYAREILSNKAITDIQLWCQKWSNDTLKTLLFSLDLERIYCLRLNNNDFTDLQLETLANFLLIAKKLQLLDLTNCKLSLDNLSFLFSEVQPFHLIKLTHLNLSGNRVDNQLLTKIIFKKILRLKELSLEYSQFMPNDLTTLVYESPSYLRQLTKLSLANNPVGDAAVCQLLTTLCIGPPDMSQLILSGCQLSDKSVQPINDFLQQAKELNSLDLYGNQFTVPGNEKIAEVNDSLDRSVAINYSSIVTKERLCQPTATPFWQKKLSRTKRINPRISDSFDALKPGDILFRLNSTGDAVDCTVYTKEAQLTSITHSVAMHYPNITKIGLPEGSYCIVRPHATMLADRAAAIAQHWLPYSLHFDSIRSEAAIRKEQAIIAESTPENFSQHLVDAAKAEFQSSGKYRAIKFAARRETVPHLPASHGFSCAMLAIATYQAAALVDQVSHLVTVDSGWVSNKHADDVLSQTSPHHWFKPFARSARKKTVNEYIQHQRHLRENSSCPNLFYNQPNKFLPSTTTWNTKKYGEIASFDFEKALTPGLCIDCKTAGPQTFLTSLMSDTTHWSVGNRFRMSSVRLNNDEQLIRHDIISQLTRNSLADQENEANTIRKFFPYLSLN